MTLWGRRAGREKEITPFGSFHRLNAELLGGRKYEPWRRLGTKGQRRP